MDEDVNTGDLRQKRIVLHLKSRRVKLTSTEHMHTLLVGEPNLTG